MASPGLELERDGAVATVWLNRPEKRNAFDDTLASEIAACFTSLGADRTVRAVVLAGRGKAFCAGGDLGWMRRAADYSPDENLADAAGFQQAYESVDRCAHPVVGRLHGAAMGGGAGLVAACDIVVASPDAVLAFPEVRLGLVPGVIGPYVVRKIGASHARHLFLTGERIDAHEAHRLGLVHVLSERDGLDAAVDKVLGALRAGGPEGVRDAKRLVHELGDAADHEASLRIAREAIVRARASDDGREGTSAFLEKRTPGWVETHE